MTCVSTPENAYGLTWWHQMAAWSSWSREQCIFSQTLSAETVVCDCWLLFVVAFGLVALQYLTFGEPPSWLMLPKKLALALPRLLFMELLIQLTFGLVMLNPLASRLVALLRRLLSRSSLPFPNR